MTDHCPRTEWLNAVERLENIPDDAPSEEIARLKREERIAFDKRVAHDCYGTCGE